MSNITNVRNRVKRLDVSQKFEQYTKVVINIDDKTRVVAGEDGGRVFEIDNPFGTQALANTILQKLSQYRYQPYEASGAMVDPAAELGDGVGLSRVYGGLYKQRLSFTHAMVSDICADQDEEINHEFQFKSATERKFQRELKGVEATLSIQSGLIAAKVNNTNDNESFSWELLSDHWSVLANSSEVFRLARTGAKVVGEIIATSGEIGGCTIRNGVLEIENANIKNLNAEKITAGYLDVQRLENNSVPGSKVSDYSIGSSKYGAGSVNNYSLGSGSVSYGKTSFTGTLDQVGVNKSNIAAINNMFASNLTVQLLTVVSGFRMYSGGSMHTLRFGTPSSMSHVLGY